jgi:predicted N-acetyltransferase YhbS
MMLQYGLVMTEKLLKTRKYSKDTDYERVGEFLIETYQPGKKFTNWLQPRWEYMHFHPFVWEIDLGKIGIFEEDGVVVGVVNMESNERTAYFQVRPNYEFIKPLMFEYAEKHYQGISQSTGRLIRTLYIHEDDDVLLKMAQSGGYEPWRDFDDHNAQLRLDQPIPQVSLPEGFRIQSLSEENDLHKINRVLWAGFNHEGPAPEEEVEGRRFMQRAPNFNKDLTIVVCDPDGNYISYCGMWVVPQNKYAYVEPVATVPEYRRKGFGKAAVLESLRRAKALGAEIAWVGSDIEFYQALGFETMFKFETWVKTLD